jgi:hypothetical protein
MILFFCQGGVKLFANLFIQKWIIAKKKRRPEATFTDTLAF